MYYFLQDIAVYWGLLSRAVCLAGRLHSQDRQHVSEVCAISTKSLQCVPKYTSLGFWKLDYGIIAVELGVLCSVTTVMIAIFYAFGSRQPEVDEDNW